MKRREGCVFLSAVAFAHSHSSFFPITALRGSTMKPLAAFLIFMAMTAMATEPGTRPAAPARPLPPSQASEFFDVASTLAAGVVGFVGGVTLLLAESYMARAWARAKGKTSFKVSAGAAVGGGSTDTFISAPTRSFFCGGATRRATLALDF